MSIHFIGLLFVNQGKYLETLLEKILIFGKMLIISWYYKTLKIITFYIQPSLSLFLTYVFPNNIRVSE